jgi:hypothetical protein
MRNELGREGGKCGDRFLFTFKHVVFVFKKNHVLFPRAIAVLMSNYFNDRQHEANTFLAIITVPIYCRIKYSL